MALCFAGAHYFIYYVMKRIIFLLATLVFLEKFYSSAQIDFDPEKHPNWDLLPDSSECGMSTTNRIIGGDFAALGQYPWIVQIRMVVKFGNLRIPGQVTCDGTIINSLYVLTAAHCQLIHNRDNDMIGLMVIVGEYDERTNPDCNINNICAPPIQQINVAEMTVHKNYTKNQHKNDIFLLRLEKPIQFSDFVAPICMIQGALINMDLSGLIVDVAGWGVVDIISGKTSPVLKTLKVLVLENTACGELFGDMAVIGNDQLCAGGTVGEDSCSGDSGGPLMKVFDIDGLPKYYIVGIVSFGVKNCGDSTMPGVYTRVSHFIKWILDNIKP